MAPLPVLVVAALAAVVQLLHGPSSSGGKTVSTDLIRWAVAAFPALAATEGTFLIILAVHAVTTRRHGRSSHA
ncbi:hypothetical protein ACIBCO_40045 [Streptomyces violascens]|uniref:hypothetical protein n=1 Tax=Streptomyces violascens TaxID=67381 RepID=UPI0037910D99